MDGETPHSLSLGKWRLLGGRYGSLWWPWGGGCGGWGKGTCDLGDGWAPVESRLELQGSGLKGFFLTEASSFFFCSF